MDFVTGLFIDSAWAQATRTALGYPADAANLSLAQRGALRALYTTRQTFDATGNVTLLTDPSDRTIATEYDAFGNAVKITDQRGNSGYFHFDNNNRQVLHVDPEGYVTRTVYNAFVTAAVLSLVVMAPLGYIFSPQLLGLVNAAPFSFFNGVTASPPTLLKRNRA